MIPDITDDLALLLGMFAGDGCLPISHIEDGNRIYPISFYNTNKAYIDLFSTLFENLFGTKGSVKERSRPPRKLSWTFEKYSVNLYRHFVRELEMANGKKALSVKIPSFIMKGNDSLKTHFFLGLLITDGSLKSNGSIMFHVASKQLTKDLQTLIRSVWGFRRFVNVFLQRDEFVSYQISLNKEQSSTVLHCLPRVYSKTFPRFLVALAP